MHLHALAEKLFGLKMHSEAVGGQTYDTERWIGKNKVMIIKHQSQRHHALRKL